jgi:hypothetical protein
LNRAIKLNPRDAKYFYARGRHLEPRDKKAAEQDFNQVLDLGFRQEPREPLLFLSKQFLDTGYTLPLEDRAPKLQLGAGERTDVFRLKQQIGDDLKRIWGGEP